MTTFRKLASLAVAATFVVSSVMPVTSAFAEAAPDGPVYGAELQGFDYPYPVSYFTFQSQRQTVRMAYMDVAPEPAKANGQTAVLLHGKNYCAATWSPTIGALHDAGYRVIAMDQIGFCKSTKPDNYQYTFAQLARNTHDLLQSLGVTQATLIGHSTGGMLAIRYALTYPEQLKQLVLVDPIGLEDWRAKGVPPVSVDQWYERELHTSADRIRNYEKNTYFAGQWRADYEPSVQMLAGMYRGPQRNLVAWNSALLYDMILTQPVYYELPQLKTPTLLMIGDKDNTAIGKEYAPPAIRPTLGNYPELAREAAKRIPHVQLVEFPDAGHAPQMQIPDQFHAALLKGMANVDEAARKALAPSGTLRASINLGNPVLARLNPATGKPEGVSVDLAAELARQLGVPLETVVVRGAGASVANVDDDKADIGFFAVDPKRAAQIRFTKPYVLIEGAYAVRDASPIHDSSDVDRQGVTVAVGKDSAYDLFLTRELQHATLVRIPTAAGVTRGFLDQHLDVAAGIKPQLEKDAAQAGGMRLLPKPFMVIRQAMGVPTRKGTDAADYVAHFVEAMKASGFVAASLKRHGVTGASVASVASGD